MLAIMMLLSVLLPALLYADTIGIVTGAKYDKVTGKVTATVYSTTYNSSVPDQVYLNVYTDDRKPWYSLGSAANATYRYDNATNSTYFDFSYTPVTPGVYPAVYLQGAYLSGITADVYVPDSHDYSNPAPCCSPGGGGSGYGWPSASDGKITVYADGKVNADDLAKAFAAAKSVEIKLSGGDFALIPAAGLLEAVKVSGAMLKVVGDNGAYLLPLSVFKLDELAAKLGIDVKDLQIKVSISKADSSTAASVKSSLGTLAGVSLADPVDFSVLAVGKDNKTVEVDFGNTYVARQIKLSGDGDSSKTTGLVWDSAANRLSFVPSTFEKVDGANIATLWRNSSSVYTVATFNKSFSDVTGHWAQSYIDLLANKLVVDGVTDSLFEPNRSITRAEFAALVVRSLGLKIDASGSQKFSDVKSSDWYAGVVAAASQTGIIDGYEDGTFKADRQISREELAAMVVRAMKYAGVDTSVSASEQASLLSKFKDTGKIVWGQRELAVAVKAGIVDGMTDTQLGSNLQATRAQSATMLKRFLGKAGFIN